MQNLSNDELIKKALALINIKVVNEQRVHGDVSCILISKEGNLYQGVNISSHVGICAEQTASGAMVTAGEYLIKKIVVTRNENGNIYVIPPCGRCREFLTKIDEANLDTEIILDRNHSVKLRELLPHHKDYKKLTETFKQ